MAGEIVGLDGMFKEKTPSSAVALEESEVCAVPINLIKELGDQWTMFRQSLMEMMQNEIEELNHLLITLNTKKSSDRLATFLINYSEKNAAKGMSAQHLKLYMTRTEIGNYLGLKIETVSRKLSLMSMQGLIKIERRTIQIPDLKEFKASLTSSVEPG